MEIIEPLEIIGPLPDPIAPCDGWLGFDSRLGQLLAGDPHRQRGYVNPGETFQLHSSVQVLFKPERAHLSSGLLSAIVVPDEGRHDEYKIKFVLCTLQQEEVDLTDTEALVPADDEETMKREHADCPSCICGRRAAVQGNRNIERGKPGHGPGTISWSEHELAWSAYAAQYGRDQTPQRMHERGGFCYLELTTYLGHEPETWVPAGTVAERERY